MLKKSRKGFYFLETLASQKGLIHGFSTRQFGDCNPLRTPQRNWPHVEGFLKTLGLERKNLVLMEQTHSRSVKVVGRKEAGKILPQIDGLLTRERGLILGLHTADCLPILFYDPVAKIVGAVHAGWQGTFKEIPRKAVELMIRLGSIPENIFVGVGPFIGGCCYNVEKERADKFKRKFGRLKGMVERRNGRLYLDLGKAALFQLTSMGVKEEKIEFSGKCTSCHNQDFFSKRKNKPEDYGGILSVISF